MKLDWNNILSSLINIFYQGSLIQSYINTLIVSKESDINRLVIFLTICCSTYLFFAYNSSHGVPGREILARVCNTSYTRAAKVACLSYLAGVMHANFVLFK